MKEKKGYSLKRTAFLKKNICEGSVRVNCGQIILHNTIVIWNIN